MKKIAILIPTRERLDDFKIFAESWKNTTEGFSDVIVGIDNDDKTYEEIKKEYPMFIYEYNERKPFLHILNDLAIKYSNKYDYLAFMEDDCNFNTNGWESIFIKKLKELGDYGIVWGNDLVNGEYIVGLPFLNSKIVKKLGFMSPPILKHLWVDHFWKAVGKEMNSLYYFSDVVVEHRHYSKGKRVKDNISIFVDSKGGEDCESYAIYMKNDFYNDIQKLKND